MSLSEIEWTPQVVHLAGTDREIGLQHGEQVAGVRDGMMAFYEHFWERLRALGKNASPRGWALLEAGGFRLAKRLFSSPSDRWARERALGLVDAIGGYRSDLELLLVLPDALPFMQFWASRLGWIAASEVRLPALGCSSFVARRGQFLSGRNLDFPGNGYWDRFPVIQVTQRTGCLKTIGITTAGVPFCGITGVNEAGISISLHQHYGAVSARGGAAFCLSENVLQKARSLEEAVDQIRSSRVRASWGFVVTDAAKKRACIVEKSPLAQTARVVDEIDSCAAHTNFFSQTPALHREFSASAKMNWDNWCRAHRMQSQIESRSPVGIADAAKILGDSWDPIWKSEKLLNRTIAQVYNVQSIVFDWDSFSMWFAEGREPRFRRWDLHDLFRGNSGRTDEWVEAFRYQDKALQPAKRALVEAFQLCLLGKISESIPWLEEAHREALRKRVPLETGGLLAVALAKTGSVARAIEILRKALEIARLRIEELRITRLPPEWYETTLFLARCLDLQGDSERMEAMRIYRSLAEDPRLEDDHIRACAQKAKRYTVGAMRKTVLPFSTYASFD